MKKIITFIIIIILGIYKSLSQENKKAEWEFKIYFLEALKYEVKGDYKNALKILLELKKIYNEKEIIDFKIANILYNLKDYNSALKFAIKSYEKDKNNIWYGILLLELLKINEKYDSAIIISKELYKKFKNPELNNLLIELYIKKNKIKKAKNTIKKVKKDFVDDTRLILKEIEIEKNKKRREKLIKDALKNNPNNLEYKYLYLKERDDKENLINFLEENKENNENKKEIINEIIKLKCEKNLIEENENYIINNVIRNNELKIKEKIEILNNSLLCIKNYERLIKELKDSTSKYEKNIILYEILLLLKKINQIEYIREKLMDLYNKSKNVEYLKYLFDLEENNENKLKILEEIEKNDQTKNCQNKILKIDLLFKIKKYDENIEKIYNEIRYLCYDIYRNNEKYFDYILAEYFRNINEFKKSDSIFISLIERFPEDNLIKNNFSYYKALREEDLEFIKRISYETIKKEKNNYHYLDTYAWIMYKMKKINKSKKYIKKAYRLMKIKNEINSEIIEHYKIIMNK